MNAHLDHSTQKLPICLLALATCALIGCWEEIHYAPPAGGTAQEAPSPRSVPEYDESAEDDSGFGESLATTPVIEPVEPTSGTGEVAEATGETASEVSDPAPSPPVTDASRNTRRVAWLLGSKLSLAALANDRGADAAEVAKWFDQSRRLAEILGTTVGELPPQLATADGADGAGIDYLFAEGQRIGRDLAAGHGDDHAAAFELAVKSNILLALYQPGAGVAGALAGGIEAAGRRAGLRAEYFAPIANVVAARGTPGELRDAVYEMYRQVDERLSTAQP